MQNTVALVDLQGYSPNLQQLKAMLAQYGMLYLFHPQNQCPFTLSELNELSTLINSGQVIILDLPQNCHQEYQYAVLVGQLLVLLDLELSVALWSAQPQAVQLRQLLEQAGLQCSLQLLPMAEHLSAINNLSSSSADLSWSQRIGMALDVLLQPLQDHPLISNYMPLSLRQGLERLRKIKRVDQTPTTQQPLAVMPSNTQADHPSAQQALVQGIETLIESAGLDAEIVDDMQLEEEEEASSLHFHPSDQVHFELLRQLQQKQAVMPKDIYMLKDLFSEIFPEADANLLIKALIKRGYIYWNGHEVTYSYEMYLN